MVDRRAQTIDLLVDEAVTKAIDGGLILGNELAFRAKKRQQAEAQADRHPEWIQKQTERYYGTTHRPGSMPTCPWCDLTFHPADEEAVRGGDDLLYCRQGCADRTPFATFGETLAQHPEWAEQLAFVANILERRGLGGGTVGLTAIHPPPTPAGDDLPF